MWERHLAAIQAHFDEEQQSPPGKRWVFEADSIKKCVGFGQ